jgi:hypothetical protein
VDSNAAHALRSGQLAIFTRVAEYLQSKLLAHHLETEACEDLQVDHEGKTGTIRRD